MVGLGILAAAFAILEVSFPAFLLFALFSDMKRLTRVHSGTSLDLC
jgi:hypothetical protein